MSQGSSKLALRITPPQRFSKNIKGWDYKIREKPGQNEYRYIRITWKSDGAEGIMLELANAGAWPEINSPKFRYYAGRNSSPWMGTLIAAEVPKTWTTVTRDFWKDFGDCNIIGIAPTAMSGAGLFDRIELLQNVTESRKFDFFRIFQRRFLCLDTYLLDGDICSNRE